MRRRPVGLHEPTAPATGWLRRTGRHRWQRQQGSDCSRSSTSVAVRELGLGLSLDGVYADRPPSALASAASRSIRPQSPAATASLGATQDPPTQATFFNAR